MIPKQLFFIWLGDNKPNYVDFAVKAFKDVNPDFKVDLIEGKINIKSNIVIKNENSDLIEKAFYEAKNEITNELHMNISDCKESFVLMKTSNHLRYNLLKDYGGIFLDCDTFPIKPFDEKLLKQSFRVTRSYNNDEFINEEIFFLGKEKGKGFNFDRLLFPCDAYNNEKFSELKPKFFNCTLKYGEYFGEPKYNYIDHYNHYSWA